MLAEQNGSRTGIPAISRAFRIVLVVAAVAGVTACTDAPGSVNDPPSSQAATATSVPASSTQKPNATGGLITDGIWAVGAQVPAGTYQATADVSEKCYWWTYRGTAEKPTEMSSGVPGGGRPTVTLVAGQTFQVWNCGTWAGLQM